MQGVQDLPPPPAPGGHLTAAEQLWLGRRRLAATALAGATLCSLLIPEHLWERAGSLGPPSGMSGQADIPPPTTTHP